MPIYVEDLRRTLFLCIKMGYVGFFARYSRIGAVAAKAPARVHANYDGKVFIDKQIIK